MVTGRGDDDEECLSEIEESRCTVVLEKMTSLSHDGHRYKPKRGEVLE